MNNEIFTRTEMLIGQANVARLHSASVLVFGVGGVGSFAVEALTRAGIGTIGIVDSDRVAYSNINRQIIALNSTVGEMKTAVAERRMRDINPDITVNRYDLFFDESTVSDIPFEQYDYVIDAIDSVSSKLLLIERCICFGIPVISSMGTGNKLDPSRLRISDISKTSVCPLARVMRRELRNRGINHLKVLYSEEEPIKTGNHTPGSISFVPSVAGLLIASEAVGNIIDIDKKNRP